jgi:predicted HTH transcriptional regulator
MVNTDQGIGYVVFGIDPNGIICGVDPGNLDKAQITIAQHFDNKFEPQLQLNIEIWECNSVSLIAVHGRRAPSCAYHEYDGRAFIREGSISRQLFAG